MTNRLEALLCAVGCLLVLSSPGVGYLLGGNLTWSDAEAQQLQQASQEYHDALHDHSGVDAAGRLDAARQHYVVQQAALERTQRWGVRGQSGAKWLGVLAVAAGVAVYYVKQSRQST